MIGVFVAVALLGTGCAPSAQPVSLSAGTQPAALTPFLTATASVTPSPAGPGTPTPLPSPTATPRTHTVAAGEDLGGIAYRYHLTLQALVAANPNVNPNAMSIGTVLVIPAGAAPTETGVPTLTPVPVKAQRVECHPSQEGGLWCFWLVRNNQKTALENLSAVIRVADKQASKVISQTAIPPLNLLPSKASLPLAAYFPPPVPSPFQASAELLTSLPVPANSGRYLAAHINGQKITIAADGRSARAQGSVELDDAQKQASLVWVAAVAYDADGSVAGLRRWENAQPPAAGQPVDFDFNVYTTGAAIARVELLVEARP